SSKRTYASGAEKRKKKKTDEEKRSQDKGAILKYFGGPVQGEPGGPSSASDQQAAGPSSPTDLDALLPVFGQPIDPADWPSVLADSFRFISTSEFEKTGAPK
ncbi:hypothetical protein IRJ41_018409, partial [Triplophysa rosa]